MDQMSLYFQATLTRVWSPIGQTPIVRVSPQRDHLHFYGAFDVRGGREIAMTTLEETSLITQNFLIILLSQLSSPPILLLLDRAPWHFAADIDQLEYDSYLLQQLYFPSACT